MDNNEAIIQLKSLNLDINEYAVFGSGPMFAHGLRPWEELSDLDMIIVGKSWDIVRGLAGNVEYDNGWKCEHVDIYGGTLEFWNGWGPKQYDIRQLIKNAEIIDGIPFVKLEDVLEWKLAMGREKDLKHVEIIQNFLKSRKS